MRDQANCGSDKIAKLTVGLPVYNAMPYLPEAVASILNQSFKDFKFIIVDDGSTDGSGAYLESLQDPRITVIHKANEGLGTTLNYIIDRVDTEYYARMDADDFSLPQRFRAQLTCLETHPEIVLLGTQVEFIVGKRTMCLSKTPTSHDQIVKMLLKGHPVLCHSSLMMRMDAVKKIRGYRIERAGEDFDFFLRMCEVGTIINLGEIYHRYRFHLNSIVTKRYEENIRGKAYAIACAKYRMAGFPEPSFREFEERWLKRSQWRKMIDRIDGWSTYQYRKSLLDIAEKKRIRGIIRLILAAACRPAGVLRQVTGVFQVMKKRCSLFPKKTHIE